MSLVADQVTQATAKRGALRVKGIFLVGGFGSSRYLKLRLEEIYKKDGIQIIQPHDAWGAIVKGAALNRVSDQASVVSTKAAHHYGVTAWSQYDRLVDRGRPTLFYPADGFYRVEKVSPGLASTSHHSQFY
jgi:hypothetical protein